MYNRLRLYTPIICTLMVLCAVLVFITPFFSRTLFYFSVAVMLLGFIAVLIMLKRTSARTRRMLREMGRGIEAAGGGEFIDFPMPVITLYDSREIIWYNDICESHVFDGADMRGEDIGDVFPTLDVTAKSPPQGYDVVFGGQQYTAFVSRSKKAGENIAVIYLIDDTALKLYSNEYHQTKPSVAIIMVDNYDEMIQDLKEGERAQIISAIEEEVERYINQNDGFVIRVGRDRFFSVIEERGIRKIIENKFGLLDIVRNKNIGEKMNATLSIGVSGGSRNLLESESSARQALDMCLGRGGDQAAVKTQNGYEFYGGVSKGIEKRTKVKTRIIANALGELLESAHNVVIMGHRFADLDCLGASAGLLKTVKDMGKPCVVCLDKRKNLARPLLDKLLAGSYDESDFIDPESILTAANDNTLLIIVDTHVSAVLESEELYRACKQVVIIDHHRKLVNHIDNAVIFYHEPYASSASEMVAELVQYFPSRPQITKLEAEAMLAGIMLDTKNFVLRTGVRTFEAAAYLRRLGADTIEVRRLFASTMDSYQQKANLVSGAVLYENCAIALSSDVSGDIKLVAPQAADELMTIEGVDASFVIFEVPDGVNVSARSMGAVNVQVIMETLGGGGHHTMAAAQFQSESMENVRKMVMEAIDSYHASHNMKA
ncbi:MAG: DHH family phosphoesterase [Oscillospiraceae bacterium]|nr:DHH family phosphoesterase [Oscillospiraceae bacterium]